MSAETQTLNLCKTILSSTTAVWFGILLLVTWCKLYFVRPIPSKPVIISAMILYSSVCIAHIINAYCIATYNNWDDLTNPIHQKKSVILLCLYSVFICMALVSCYIFTESLLIYTFKGSAFAMPKKVIYCHIVNITLIIIIVLFTIILRNLMAGYRKTAYVTMSIFIILFGFGFLHFVYLFNSNLFKLILSNYHADDHDQFITSRISTSSNGSHKQQLGLLKLIIKFSVLTTVSFIFLIFTTLIGISVAIAMSITNGDHTSLRIVYWFCYFLFLIFGSLLIFLSFEMNYRCYQCLCNKCHKQCEQICETVAQKSIAKRTNQNTKYYLL